MTDSIFTTVQQRRNSKAIAAAIAEHGDNLTAQAIPQIADELASKYAWSVRRDAFHTQIVKALEAHYAQQHGMKNRKEIAAERVAAKRAENVMASRALIAGSDIEIIECNLRGEVIEQDQDYTIATTEGVVIAQVEHHDVTDTANDDPDGHTISKLESELADANDDIDLLQAEVLRLKQELQEVREELAEVSEEWERTEKEAKQLQSDLHNAEKAMEAMSDMQEWEAKYGSRVESALHRVNMGLAIDSWDDEYVRKDIEAALKQAEQYAGIISETVQEYISTPSTAQA